MRLQSYWIYTTLSGLPAILIQPPQLLQVSHALQYIVLFIVIKRLQKQCIIINFLTQWIISCAFFAALVSSLSTDGYQMVVGGSQSKLIPDMTLTNIQVSNLQNQAVFVTH